MFSFSHRRKSEQEIDGVKSPDGVSNSPEREITPDAIPESRRSQFNTLLKQGWDKGIELSKEEAMKGKAYLEKSLGLGARPNVIPEDDAVVTGQLRTVALGWHPVAGFGGKWFAEQTRLGQKITKAIGKYPDPTQHWAVLVGDYCHQLWMDENLDVIYINEKIISDQWHTFDVGKTRFNDEALRQAGEMTIHNMREKRPAYNLISNNCQNFAVNLLDAVQIGAHREFATTFAIYQRATGKGAIKDLFAEPPLEEATSPAHSQETHEATMQYAQQVIDDNTTQLDHHDCADHRYHHHFG